MLTHLRTQETNERGALMIEAIALLGLMTMMSPMVVKQTADRTSEMEEVTIAGQIKELKDALNNWISANYNQKANEIKDGENEFDDKFTLTANDLAPYLPASSLEYNDGNFSFRGNKLIENFQIGVRAQCTELRRTNGLPCEPGTCFVMNQGTATRGPDGANAKCSRYKMTGMILSDNSTSGEEIDERRAARIASMIGADGGHMRSSRMMDAMEADDTEKKRILGSQGVWEGSLDDFFDVPEGNIQGGRVAATTVYSSGFSGDYLYRKRVDGLPDANSMFTDLDMGGNTECNAEGTCHRINNAGGMEIIGGQLLIRSQNGTAANNARVGSDTDADYAQIALGLQDTHIETTGKIDLQAFNNTSALHLANQGATLQAGSSSMVLNNTNITSTATSGITENVGVNQRTLTTAKAQTSVLNAEQTLENDTFNVSLSDGNDTLSLTTNWLETNAGGFRLGLGDGKDIGEITNNDIEGGGFAVNTNAGESYMALTNEQSKIKVGPDGSYQHITTEMAETSVARNAAWTKLESGQAQTSVSGGDGQTILTGDSATTSVNNAEAFLNRDRANITINDNEERKASISLKGNIAETYINNEGARFALVDTTDTEDYSFMVDLYSSATKMNFNKDGLKLTRQHKAADGTDRDMHNTDSPSIALDVNTGRITGSFFQPGNEIFLDNNQKTYTIQNHRRLTVDDNRDSLTEGKEDLINDFVKDTALVGIDLEATAGAAPYRAHHDRDLKYYDRFRVDPAFISVMNDIKLTSRGGARLSEALPNYILKGIYVLTNSYTAGPWPCTSGRYQPINKDGQAYGSYLEAGGGSCEFDMPYYQPLELGVSSGGYEFNCKEDQPDTQHPITNGGGSCTPNGSSNGNGHVHFSYLNDIYHECEFPAGDDDYECWAHPFMGVVPAPGRTELFVKTVKHGKSGSFNDKINEVVRAQDEGPCPDGYVAVLTITPNIFEFAKVLTYDTTAMLGVEHDVRYNPGYLDYTDQTMRDAAVMIQSPTKVGVQVTQHLAGGAEHEQQLLGWYVAMGTITPTPTGYIWNVGGVPANSWQAVAHTYCYFNPDRFAMPNMRFIQLNDNGEGIDASVGDTNVLITPMDNPLLINKKEAFD